MKNILLSIFILLIATSCKSTFFYSKLASTSSDVEQVENGDFLIDSDSLWVAYSFKGQDAPIRITVFNKSETPIYVDWSKSAMILGNESFIHNNMVAIVSAGEVYQQPDLFDINGKYIGNYAGKIDIPNHISYIPSQTMMSIVPAWIKLIDFDGIPKKSYTETTLPNKKGEAKKVKKVDFTETSTPLKFKCLLTIYLDEYRTNMKIIKQEFYLKTLLKTTALKPDDLDKKVIERGDLFFYEKEANRPVVGIATGVAIGSGSGSVDVFITN